MRLGQRAEVLYSERRPGGCSGSTGTSRRRTWPPR